MTGNLKRYYGQGHAHYITCSCDHRHAFLGRPGYYPLLLRYIETIRKRYRFHVGGYVLMPNHFHLLIGEPKKGDPSDVMFALKQTFSRRVLKNHPELEHFWEKRFYDFNIYTRQKLVEKIHYMHKNPVVAGLCKVSEDWPWSSCRYFKFNEEGTVKIEFDELVEGEEPPPFSL